MGTNDDSVCRWCKQGKDLYVTGECAECGAGRAWLESLPVGSCISLLQAISKAKRAQQQRGFAAENPEHYAAGWRKRHAQRREMSEYLTSITEKPRK